MSKPTTIRGLLVELLAAVRSTNASIVGTAETCRRLNMGKDQLDDEVEAGHISRVPHMRGIGAGHCYHVDEIRRYAAARAAGERSGAVARIGRVS